MIIKKKLPLALGVSIATMTMMHLLMPINIHGDSEAKEARDVATSHQKRSISVIHPLESCPEDGELLTEDTPYWSEMFEDYKKVAKYELDFVGEKPLSDTCCAPDNFTKKSVGYINPPEFTDKSLNPCWYDDKKLRCMPYFYIIGASKSATTDLFSRLMKHPDIKSTRKDIHWISRLRTLGAGLSWYTANFNAISKDIHTQITTGTSKTVIGEASLDYLSDVHVWPHFTGNQGCYEPRITIANHLRHINPNARIIISLRDPVERVSTYYTYTAAAREKLKDPSINKLHEFVNRASIAYRECFKKYPVRACVYNRTLAKQHPVDLVSGAYAPFVEDWLRVFPREQIYFVKFEDYSKDMAATVKDIVKFLQLPPFSDSAFNQMKSMPKHPQNEYYKIQPLQNRTIKVISDFLNPFNSRLAKMLNDNRFLWK